MPWSSWCDRTLGCTPSQAEQRVPGSITADKAHPRVPDTPGSIGRTDRDLPGGPSRLLEPAMDVRHTLIDAVRTALTDLGVDPLPDVVLSLIHI